MGGSDEGQDDLSERARGLETTSFMIDSQRDDEIHLLGNMGKSFTLTAPIVCFLRPP